MSSLVLNMTKEGEAPKKLALNLQKNEKFRVKLMWEGNADLDVHALFCINDGNGAKASSFEDILSPYNVKRRIGNQQQGTLDKKADGTFEIRGGALVHSADATDGDKLDVDEWILFDPAKVPPVAAGVVEVPLVATIHNAESNGLRFRDVKNATILVENAEGREVLRASLSSQFAEFTGVQTGSIMMDESGTNFVTVGSGFTGDFNAVLAFFS